MEVSTPMTKKHRCSSTVTSTSSDEIWAQKLIHFCCLLDHIKNELTSPSPIIDPNFDHVDPVSNLLNLTSSIVGELEKNVSDWLKGPISQLKWSLVPVIEFGTMLKEAELQFGICAQKIKEFCELVLKAHAQFVVHGIIKEDQGVLLHASKLKLDHLLVKLTSNSLVVREQPPSILEIGAKISVSAEFLAAVDTIFWPNEDSRPKINWRVVQLDQLPRTTEGGICFADLPLSQMGSFDASHSHTDVLFTVNSCQPRKWHIVYYYCHFMMEGHRQRAYCCSRPFLSIPKQKRKKDTAGAIFWYNHCQMCPDGSPADGGDGHPAANWSQLSTAFETYFKREAGVQKSFAGVHFMALQKMIFGNTISVNEDGGPLDAPLMVTHDDVFKRRQREVEPFSFWDWFNSIIHTFRHNDLYKALWDAGILAAFLDTRTTEKLLMGQPTGTFLIRFSTTCLQSFVISFVSRLSSKIIHCRLHVDDLLKKSLLLRIQSDSAFIYILRCHCDVDEPKKVKFAAEFKNIFNTFSSLDNTGANDVDAVDQPPKKRGKFIGDYIMVARGDDGRTKYFDLEGIELKNFGVVRPLSHL